MCVLLPNTHFRFYFCLLKDGLDVLSRTIIFKLFQEQTSKPCVILFISYFLLFSYINTSCGNTFATITDFPNFPKWFYLYTYYLKTWHCKIMCVIYIMCTKGTAVFTVAKSRTFHGFCNHSDWLLQS